jgi:hypothetical protein
MSVSYASPSGGSFSEVQCSSITRIDRSGPGPKFRFGASSAEEIQIVFRTYDRNLRKIGVYLTPGFTGSRFFQVLATPDTKTIFAGIIIRGYESFKTSYTIYDCCCCEY